jgi:hypothetical protein
MDMYNEASKGFEISVGVIFVDTQMVGVIRTERVNEGAWALVVVVVVVVVSCVVHK